METGTPYLCCKDAVNEKSNQKTLASYGPLISAAKSPNTRPRKRRMHARIYLSTRCHGEHVDFDKLTRITTLVARNLDKVIDVNVYPSRAKTSNERTADWYRCSRLADVFQMLCLPMIQKAQNSIGTSLKHYIMPPYRNYQQAAELGPYASYEGSPASEGKRSLTSGVLRRQSVTGSPLKKCSPGLDYATHSSLHPCPRRLRHKF